jgi:hypothetical protein
MKTYITPAVSCVTSTPFEVWGQALSLPGQHAKAQLFTPPHPLLRAGRPGECCPFPGRSHAGQSFGVELRQCSAGRAASLRPDRVRSAHVSRAWRPWGGDVAEPSIPLRSLACPASIEPKITVPHADCTYRLHAFIALRPPSPKGAIKSSRQPALPSSPASQPSGDPRREQNHDNLTAASGAAAVLVVSTDAGTLV